MTSRQRSLGQEFQLISLACYFSTLGESLDVPLQSDLQIIIVELLQGSSCMLDVLGLSYV